MFVRQFSGIISSNCNIDLTDLCIIDSLMCWIVYIDCLILTNNGNILDALLLCCNYALNMLEIPPIIFDNPQLNKLHSKEQQRRIKNREKYLKMISSESNDLNVNVKNP